MRFRKAMLAVSTALLFALAACSSSASGTSGTSGGSAPASTTKLTKSTLYLGSIGEMSGPLSAEVADAPAAALAFESWVNAHGGINSHPLKIIFGDDLGDPTKTLSVLENMVEQQHIIGLFGMFSADGGMGSIAQYVQAKGLPVIGALSGDPAADMNTNVFMPHAGSVAQGRVLEPVIARLSAAKKVAVFYCKESPACAADDSSISKLAVKSGLQDVYDAQLSVATADFTAPLLTARSKGAQAIIVILQGSNLATIYKNMQRLGYTAQLVGTPNVYTTSSDVKIPGLITFSHLSPWSLAPAFADYRSAMKQYQPSAGLGEYGAQTWAAGLLLQRATRDLGDNVTSASLLKALQGLKNETLGGIIPATTWGSGSHVDTDVCGYPLKYNGSQWQAPLGVDKTICG